MVKTEIQVDFEESIMRASSQTMSSVPWIGEKQMQAITRMQELGFPSNRIEEWKYYNFATLKEKTRFTQTAFQKTDAELSSGLTRAELSALINKYVFPETAANILVTVNGAFAPELSNPKLYYNFIIIDFNNPEQLSRFPEAERILHSSFFNNIEKETNYFSLVNTALFQKGFMLYLKPNTQLNEDLQIIHISNQNHFNQIRSCIHIGENSSLKLMVNYIGLDGSDYVTNAFIELQLAANSKLELSKIQNESKKSLRFYNLAANLDRNSHLVYNSLSFGSASNREDLFINLNGDFAKTDLSGLYVVNGTRASHHRLRVNHNAEHTESNQLYKGLLQDQSQAEFNGLINVSKAAQKTNASQMNRNLLLSQDVHIDSRPQLNIEADDVKCSHGSTVGSLDSNEIFYLQSRGLSRSEAEGILTYSFSQEIIQKLGLESARNYASQLAYENLNFNSSKLISELADSTKHPSKS